MNRRDALKTFATIPALGLIPAVKGKPEPFFSVSNGVETLELKREDFKSDTEHLISLYHSVSHNETSLYISHNPEFNKFWESSKKHGLPMKCRYLGKTHDVNLCTPLLQDYTRLLIVGTISPIHILDDRQTTVFNPRISSSEDQQFLHSAVFESNKECDKINILLYFPDRSKGTPLKVSDRTIIECDRREYKDVGTLESFVGYPYSYGYWIQAKSTI